MIALAMSYIPQLPNHRNNHAHHENIMPTRNMMWLKSAYDNCNELKTNEYRGTVFSPSVQKIMCDSVIREIFATVMDPSVDDYDKHLLGY